MKALRFASSVVLIGLFTLTLSGLAGCDEIKVSDRDLSAVGEEEVIAAIDDPEAVIVDVRRHDRYAEGHLPSAINIFLPDIRARDPQLAAAQQIIVYGGGWRDPLSSAAAKRMLALGYTNVHDFRGGVELWQDAGMELLVPDPQEPEQEEEEEQEDV